MTHGSLPWLCFYAAPLSTTARAPSTTRPWNSCSILPETEAPSFTEFGENDRVILLLYHLVAFGGAQGTQDQRE